MHGTGGESGLPAVGVEVQGWTGVVRRGGWVARKKRSAWLVEVKASEVGCFIVTVWRLYGLM